MTVKRIAVRAVLDCMYAHWLTDNKENLKKQTNKQTTTSQKTKQAKIK